MRAMPAVAEFARTLRDAAEHLALIHGAATAEHSGWSFLLSLSAERRWLLSVFWEPSDREWSPADRVRLEELMTELGVPRARLFGSGLPVGEPFRWEWRDTQSEQRKGVGHEPS